MALKMHSNGFKYLVLLFSVWIFSDTNALCVPPPYDPNMWNNDPVITENNNCYNYANNKITNTFAQPGVGSGQSWELIGLDDVPAASVRDREALSHVHIPQNGHIVALFTLKDGVWYDEDYHWYRLDSDGRWSHKSGEAFATNIDDNGNLIADPITCAKRKQRNPLTDTYEELPYVFQSYYLCVPEVVTIQ